jgi:hypothetical protein
LRFFFGKRLYFLLPYGILPIVIFCCLEITEEQKSSFEKEGFNEEWELRHGRRGGERFISHPCVFRNARRSPALSVFSGIISPGKGVFQCPQRT